MNDTPDSNIANVRQRLKELAVSDSGFVFDPCSGATFSANESGLAILEGLKQGQGPAELISALKDKFEVVRTEDLRRDLDEFVHMLRSNQLLPDDFAW